MKKLFLQSLAIPVVQVVFDTVMRSVWVARGGSKRDVMVYAVGLFACWALSFVFTGLVSLARLESRRAALLLAGLLAALHTCVLATNFFLFQYFGEYLFPGALAFIFDPAYLADYIRTFVGIIPAVSLLVVWSLFFACVYPWGEPPVLRRRYVLWVIPLIVVMAGAGVAALQVNDKKSEYRMPPDVVAVESLAKHFLRVRAKIWPLRPSARLPVAAASARASAKPRTVLIILNESMGLRSLTFMEGARLHGGPQGGMPRLATRMARDSAEYVVFQRAYTNSVATQVSMASFFSGVSPEESHRKLHCMPMFWDMAKVAGYKTAYFSSQRLRWATMNDFLLNQPIDSLVAREQTDHPPVNDMGIDDFHVVGTLEAWLASHPDEPLFIVWNTNALHVPHQARSEFMDLSNVPGGRYEKALQLVDSAIARVFAAFEKAGRLEDALIISTADHGEDPDPSHSVARANSYYDEYIRIPVWMKLPRSLRGGATERAARARERVPVSNIDIAPTLAHLFGLRPRPGEGEFPAECSTEAGLPWVGQSLFAPNPDVGRVLVALSTNDIRHWDGDGFGLVQGPWRMVLWPDSGRALYNIDEDPEQVVNVLETVPASVKDPFMRRIRANAWLTRIYDHHVKREGAAVTDQ